MIKMSDSFRSLLYPIGFLTTGLFLARALIQWFISEKKKTSVIPKSFWVLSILGHSIMLIHSWVQLQYPIFILQVISLIAIISTISNIKLQSKTIKIALLILTIAVSSFVFFVNNFISDNFSLMRAPDFINSTANKIKENPLDIMFKFFGCFGLFLLSIRFFLPLNKSKTSKETANSLFWLLSILGVFSSLAYFIAIKDVINILIYLFAAIPYFRNLQLIKKQKFLDKFNEPHSNVVYLVCGELSGDQLGSKLIPHLKLLFPSDTVFKGVGGKNMQLAGVKLVADIANLQVMGLQIFSKMTHIIKTFFKIKKDILNTNPRSVIFIDYQDFNLCLSKALRQKGFSGKCIQYISPSVWAWRKNRINSLAKNLDLLLCILPFEPKYYAHTKLKTVFVGNPITEKIKHINPSIQWNTFLSKHTNLKSKKILSIYPGSRKNEIIKNFPFQIESALSFVSKNPDFKIFISISQEIFYSEIKNILSKYTDLNKVALVPYEYSYNLMQSSSLAIATSGTVCLELALNLIPTIVTYKTSNFEAFLAKKILKISLPFFALPNIINDGPVFPEFIGPKINSENICLELEKINNNREFIIDSLQKLSLKLESEAPIPTSELCAQEIYKLNC